MLTREKLKATRKTETIELATLDGETATIKELMPADQQFAFPNGDDDMQSAVRLVVRCLYGEDDKRLYGDNQTDQAANELSIATIKEIGAAVIRLSGLEDEAKNV